ncbi:tetratricopeptide repeat protein [Mucilaginibacter ginkgonis]|uniref:Tetratricopeptide repeat protein n=1 Tax=Mucilaginibacter ginkgonis TaxID=2682091 RepID=A0A6I4I0L9_9SPHI|nr:tetratricopeptide repeat protein [Mucilaginibacter ginkgonis]QQL48459.1 tetratricopeptide repeat protein [Mucilaginibacter ginkgonis]
MRFPFLLFLIAITSANVSLAQNAYVKLGQQAFLEGDFKVAITRLEKACVLDTTNTDALWMLGYSYYHSDNYKKSIQAYSRVINMKPADATSYYYRARAKGFIGKDAGYSFTEREKYLLGAILDYTKAIGIEPESKTYQNRGIAYREYGLFKLDPANRCFDRTIAVKALRASIADLERVLNDNPSRSDISSQIDISKEKLALAIGRR